MRSCSACKPPATADQLGFRAGLGGEVTRPDLDAGLLERDRLATPPTTQSIFWGGLDLDLNVARAWYLMLSGIAERGGGDATSQIYGGFSTRF